MSLEYRYQWFDEDESQGHSGGNGREGEQDVGRTPDVFEERFDSHLNWLGERIQNDRSDDGGRSERTADTISRRTRGPAGRDNSQQQQHRIVAVQQRPPATVNDVSQSEASDFSEESLSDNTATPLLSYESFYARDDQYYGVNNGFAPDHYHVSNTDARVVGHQYRLDETFTTVSSSSSSAESMSESSLASSSSPSSTTTSVSSEDSESVWAFSHRSAPSNQQNNRDNANSDVAIGGNNGSSIASHSSRVGLLEMMRAHAYSSSSDSSDSSSSSSSDSDSQTGTFGSFLNDDSFDETEHIGGIYGSYGDIGHLGHMYGGDDDDDDEVDDDDIDETPRWAYFQSDSSSASSDNFLDSDYSAWRRGVYDNTGPNQASAAESESSSYTALKRIEHTGTGGVDIVTDQKDDRRRAKMNRCEQIRECCLQIQQWKKRLKVLQEERVRCAKLAHLTVNAKHVWKWLAPEEKNDEEFILAALKSPKLPSAFEGFPNGSFRPALRNNRDVLLAYVNRPDFEKRHEGERFTVPPRLRGDKEVIMRIIEKQPMVVEHMSPQLRDDEEVLLATVASIRKKQERIANYKAGAKQDQNDGSRDVSTDVVDSAKLTSTPTVSSPNFLQHFSDRLRGHPHLMQKVVCMPGYVGEMKFVSKKLRNNRSFVLRIVREHQLRPSQHAQTASVVPKKLAATVQVLKWVSQRLKADRDIVLSAVRRCGLNLFHASYPLRRDREIVRAACQNNGHALKYCLPGSTKTDIMNDDGFLRAHCFRTASTFMFRWEAWSERHSYMMDTELLLYAIADGYRWDELPTKLQEDVSFCVQALQRNCRMYLQLPGPLKCNFDVAFAAVCHDQVDDDMVLDAVDCVPELLASFRVMLHLARQKHLDIMQETLRFSPVTIRDNKAVMLEAVRNNAECFEYCTERLQQDVDIIRQAVKHPSFGMYLVQPAIQQQYPDIVAEAIRNTNPSDLWDTYDEIDPAIWWMSKEAVIAWMCQGGDWVADGFNPDFSNDREVSLAVARSSNWKEFEYVVDESMTSDKEFMLEAVAANGRVIQYASKRLKYDMDLAVLALGGNEHSMAITSLEYNGIDFLNDLSLHVDGVVSAYDSFVGLFLCGMHANPTKDAGADVDGDERSTECHLPLLNQGHETSLEWTRSIAEYADIPSGKKLRIYQNAARSLKLWGYM